MEEALKNLFTLFENDLMTPLRNAIQSSELFDCLIDFINSIGTTLARLFNNSNVFSVNAKHIASVVTFVVLVLVFYAVLSVFGVLYKAMTDAMSGEQTQWRSSWKRRKRR